MPLPPGECEVQHFFVAPGASGDIIVTLGFSQIADQDSIAAQASSIWAARIMPVMGSLCQFVNTVARVGQDGGDDLVTEWGSAVNGSKAGDLVTLNTAVLVIKNTSLPGRKNTGRLFLPCTTETQWGNASSLTAAERTAIGEAFLNLAGDHSAQGNVLAILHKAVNRPEKVIPALVRPASPATPLMTSNPFTVAVKAATQRRRLRD